MKAEKIFLSIAAIVVGLIAAAVAFYLYQMTKTIPENNEKTVTVKPKNTPTPTPQDKNYLTVESPEDESVVDKKTVKISGKTVPGSTIIVSTESSDQVVSPADNGNFTLNQSLDDDTNLIQILSIFPDGEEKVVQRTVTYSTENF